MLHEASLGDDTNPEDLGRTRTEFIEFLDDARPPLFAGETLTLLFRTYPLSPVNPDVIVGWVDEWQEERVRISRRPAVELLLGVVQRILNAYRANAIQQFDPFSFMETFGLRLGALCPDHERPAFRDGTRRLIEDLPPAPIEGKPVSSSASEAPIHDERSLKKLQEDAISKIEHQAYASDAEFDEAFAQMDRAMQTRLGLSVQTSLKRILTAAAKTLNTGRTDQARRLVQFVLDTYERFKLSREERTEIGGVVKETDINESLLMHALANEKQREAAFTIFRGILYFSPAEALITLAHEKRRERRRLLLSAFEAFGSEPYAKVLAELQGAKKSGQPWYMVRNLIYLLSRIPCPSDAMRKETIDAVGPYVCNDQPQLRTAAVVTLGTLGGRESTLHLVRGLDPGAYPAGSIDDADPLRRHLHMVMESLFSTGIDSAIAIIAEVATGAKGVDFDLGSSLRDDACAILGQRKAPLPPRAVEVVVNQLTQLVSKRLKIVTGMLSLGIDPRQCKQLAALIDDSTDSRAREILEHPVLQKIVSR